MEREVVVKRAAEMFAESGIKAIRMDDIAADLGVSKRTLYEMFEDKKELLYLSFKYITLCQNEAAAASYNQYAGSLVAILEAIRVMRDTREKYHRMNLNLKKFYPDLFEKLRIEIAHEGCQHLCDIINGLIREGLILNDIDVDLSVTILYYTLVNIFSDTSNHFLPNNVTRSEAFFYTVVNFFRGIATMDGVKQIDEYVQKQKLEVKQ